MRAVSRVSGAYVGAACARALRPNRRASSVTTRTSSASLRVVVLARGAERLRQWQPDAKELDGGRRGSARRGSVNASGPGHSARAHDTCREERFSAAWRACVRVRASRSSSATAFFLAGAFLAGAFSGGRLLRDRLLGRRLRGLAREHRVLEVLERRDARDSLRLDLAPVSPVAGFRARRAGTIDPPELREAGDRNVVAARNAVR